ncbi:MAG: mandelate racemase [Alphaproteobacteria bacterium]|nr:MAG: mandelate racemase [Alphaproteobacteria bacterium]
METNEATEPTPPLSNLSLPNGGARITRIELGRFEAVRPRSAGSNARLGEHGLHVRPPVVRLTTDDGNSGFGLAFISPAQAEMLLGVTIGEAFTGADIGVQLPFRAIEFPLWDLAAKAAGLPVYALLSQAPNPEPLRVRCYDTSLYIDDLHLTDTSEAAALIAQEARDGFERGHRAFKIKVGRGARHMPLEEGTRRDIAVIRTVREAVGPDATLMIDANNGWNLNLTKRVLDETADCRLYWVEEAFHEDAVLYRDLKGWLTERNLPILIADGEGEASPSLIRWAKEGLIDVLQYDIFGHGISRWIELGHNIADTQIGSGPHHYGAMLGNYVTGHLSRALPRFQYVEWDEAITPGIAAPGYTVENGMVVVPDTPGFGLTLDETLFQETIRANGFAVSL